MPLPFIPIAIALGAVAAGGTVAGALGLRDKTKSNKAIGINNIKYTVIYSEDNEGKMNETIIPNGYLDIGINDTMKDLMVNFIGAICFSVFGYLYIINRGKYHFVNNFIARKISN